MDKLLTDKELAETLCKSVSCLKQWRAKGIGPPFSKLGGSVRYDPKEVAEWVETHTRK